MLSLAHLRDYEAKEAKRRVSTVTERQVSPSVSSPASEQMGPQPLETDDTGNGSATHNSGQNGGLDSNETMSTSQEARSTEKSLQQIEHISPVPDNLTIVTPFKLLAPQLSSSRMSQRIKQARSRLCRTISVEPSDSFAKTSMVDLLKVVTGIRLRNIPHQGSPLDRHLRQAERFARFVNTLGGLISDYDESAREGCMTCWGCCEIILKARLPWMPTVGETLSIFDQAGLALQHTISLCATKTSKLVGVLTEAFLSVLTLCCEATWSLAALNKGSTTQVITDIESSFEKYLRSISECSAKVSILVWELAIESLDSESDRRLDMRPPVSLKDIRIWLGGHELHPYELLFDAGKLKSAEEDESGGWMKAMMAKFYASTDDLLQISGPAGCGKSRLVERLAGYIKIEEQKHTKLLCFRVDSMMTSQRSPLLVAKRLLLQLLEISVGDLSLFSALCEAYGQFQRGESSGLEGALWTLLERSLTSQSVPVLIIIDGLDQLQGGLTATEKVRNRLLTITHQRPTLRCIVLVRPGLTKPSSGVFDFSLDLALVGEEIRLFIRHAIKSSASLAFCSIQERETIIRRILERKFGSFLEAQVLIRNMEYEKSYSGVLQLLGKLPPSLNGIMDLSILRLDFTDKTTVTLLSWMLVEEKAFTVIELEKLTGLQLADSPVNTANGQKPSYRAITELRAGRLQFIHPLIRDRLRELCTNGKVQITIKAASRMVTLQSLAYIKACLPGDDEPSIRSLQHWMESKAYDDLKNDELFVHCVNSYLDYYRQSDLRTGQSIGMTFPGEFKGIFPDSTTLALAEFTYWQRFKDAASLERSLLEVLELRQWAFGKSSRSAIQTLAITAHLYIGNKSYQSALGALFEAWNLARGIHGDDHLFCIESAETYWEVSSEHEKSHGVRGPLQAQGIFRFLWETSQRRLGDTDQKVLQYGQGLASLYADGKQFEQAASIFRILHQACLRACGVLDDRTSFYAEALIQVLEHIPGQENEVQRIREALSDISMQTAELWDRRRVEHIMRLVEYYTRHQSWSEAEAKLRDYLTRLSNFTRQDSADVSLYMALGDVTIRLSRILSQRHLHEEAIQTLVKFCPQYEQGLLLSKEINISDTVLSRFRIIAEELMELRAINEATAILTKLSAWHSDNPRETSEETLLVTLALAKCFRLKTDNDNAEPLLKNMYDLLLVNGFQLDTLGSASLTICIELASFYRATGRVQAAIDVCLQTLKITWPSVLEDDSFENKSAKDQPQIVIHMAVLLVALYKEAGSKSDMERLLLRLGQTLHARFVTWEVEDIVEVEWFFDVNEKLGLLGEIVGFWEQLRERCTKVLPRNHDSFVRVSFRLAQLYRKLQRPEGENTLIEIIRDLEQNHSQGCSTSRFEAILSLCDCYEQQERYGELRKWYLTLWSSFLNQETETGVSGKQGLEIFQKYVAVLLKFQDNLGAIRLARELRAVYLAEFGTHDLYSIKAAMELAFLLESDVSVREEAVAIYEEVGKISVDKRLIDGEAKAALIRTARDRLASLLATRPDLAHRAEVIFIESWEEARTAAGYSSEQTLASLSRLIDFYRKQTTRKTTGLATKRLEITVRGIFTHERDLNRLFCSAEAVSKLYVDLNSRNSAFVLIDQIRTEFSNAQRIGFAKSSEWMDRRCLLFITAMEAMLGNKSSSTLYIDLVGDLLIETSLYESWVRISHGGASLEMRLSAGGQLLAFLERKQRETEVAQIRDELWDVFRRDLSPDSPKSGVIWKLFDVYITEMSRERSSITLLDSAVQVIVEFCQATKYQQALELSRWIMSLVRQRGGFSRQGFGPVGVKLALCLANVSISDSTWVEAISALHGLSTDILAATWIGTEDNEVDLRNTTVSQLNVMLKLFGTQKNFRMLERMFQALWDSRTERTWNVKTTISIGRRLCEVKFAVEKHTQALGLLEDICYNLRDVLGPLDSITVECERLRARLNTQCGNHGAAMDIHAHVLQQVAHSRDHQSLSHDEVAKLGMDELRNLNQTYQYCGGWGSRNNKIFVDLSQSLLDSVEDIDEDMEHIADVSSWKVDHKGPLVEKADKHNQESVSDWTIDADDEQY